MKKITLIIIIALGFVAAMYALYSYLMQIGVDEGYEPVQPIHFSHKIHAGDNKIDCKFCHSAARNSAVAGIPSLNVCMGCHNTISEYEGEEDPEYSKDFYSAEIKKLYAAVGWDEQQFKYTGKGQGVQWIRIHKLPDFTYFNHAQHVKVAGLNCQSCHGEVEKMEVVRQEAGVWNAIVRVEWILTTLITLITKRFTNDWLRICNWILLLWNTWVAWNVLNVIINFLLCDIFCSFRLYLKIKQKDVLIVNVPN